MEEGEEVGVRDLPEVDAVVGAGGDDVVVEGGQTDAGEDLRADRFDLGDQLADRSGQSDLRRARGPSRHS